MAKYTVLTEMNKDVITSVHKRLHNDPLFKNLHDSETFKAVDKILDEVQLLMEHLRVSFPLNAAYKQDKLAYAHEYIRVIREWATKNLGAAKY